MQSRLTNIRPPTENEAVNGAEIVFERADTARYTIYARLSDVGSYRQWGTIQRVIEENKEVARTWADGERKLRAHLKEGTSE